ncbi:4-hydroxy-tetrahydrodipicolinate reductase [uncultured Enterovirga sp.]|uniref:4-hydroxy-tetrahydrodipicolinate reductase n=1 Tax=uncultured Enterovirga sp. TaxID=2026352 RepID=UPI0035CAACEE
MRLVIVGAAGRMGRTLVRTVVEHPETRLAAALERPGSPVLGEDSGRLAGLGPLGIPVGDDIAEALSEADGILDFTSPAATLGFARLAAERGLVHVIGTTGLDQAHLASLREFGARARIVQSGNMSMGVVLLAGLVRRAARALGSGWDIEILEMHHRMKVDAPSGTALLLGEAAAAGRGISLSDHAVLSREGNTGAREDGAIGFAALRGGTVVGEHSVIFAGNGERIELAHRAEDRSIFARGAVQAAIWAADRPAGFYDMEDVLGLKGS